MIHIVQEYAQLHCVVSEREGEGGRVGKVEEGVREGKRKSVDKGVVVVA